VVPTKQSTKLALEQRRILPAKKTSKELIKKRKKNEFKIQDESN